MTKSEMELFDSSMLGAIALFLNQYFNCVVSEYIVLWFALVSIDIVEFMYIRLCYHLQETKMMLRCYIILGDYKTGLLKYIMNHTMSR